MYSMHVGTVIRYRSIRIMIRTNDHPPPHVHAIGGDAQAKIEIEGAVVVESVGFSRRDIERLRAEILKESEFLLEKWREIHEE